MNISSSEERSTIVEFSAQSRNETKMPADVDRSGSNASFPKAVRLLEPSHYENVFQSEKQVSRNRAFTLLAIANATGHPRLGLVVAKRKIRHSVDRNRVKRVVRESFRGARHRLPHVDIVIIAQTSAGGMTNADLFTVLEREWSKLRLLVDRCQPPNVRK